MTDPAVRDLARLVALAAADLEQRGYPMHGIVRQAARALVTRPTAAPDGGCPGCGQPVAQPERGRPRKWCGEACRSRHRRR
jgi:hypothetical protein